jgi:hypothetical protein
VAACVEAGSDGVAGRAADDFVGDFCAGTRSTVDVSAVVSFTVTSLTVGSSAAALATFVVRRALAGVPDPPARVVFGGALAGSGRWAALRGRLRPVGLSST